MRASHAIVMREEDDDTQVISALRDRCNDPLGVLERAFDRVLPRLGLKKSPLSIMRRYVRVSGVASVLRLTPRVHLEIVPKIYRASDPWREDLFFMTTLSRYGRLLSHSSLGLAADGNTYPSMMAEALAAEIRNASSRPLRLYMPSQFRDFELVGEADPIDIVSPGPEGIPQDTSSLTMARQSE